MILVLLSLMMAVSCLSCSLSQQPRDIEMRCHNAVLWHLGDILIAKSSLTLTEKEELQERDLAEEQLEKACLVVHQ